MGEYGKYVVYILASRKYGALYVGVTGNLIGRVVTHREEWLEGFTVHVEQFDGPSDAILREKPLKKWRRDWKIELIEKSNPDWDDLFDQIVG
jgi:putative endonuclease